MTETLLANNISFTDIQKMSLLAKVTPDSILNDNSVNNI